MAVDAEPCGAKKASSRLLTAISGDARRLRPTWMCLVPPRPSHPLRLNEEQSRSLLSVSTKWMSPYSGDSGMDGASSPLHLKWQQSSRVGRRRQTCALLEEKKKPRDAHLYPSCATLLWFGKRAEKVWWKVARWSYCGEKVGHTSCLRKWASTSRACARRRACFHQLPQQRRGLKIETLYCPI